MSEKTKRNGNIELLRIISMVMIVFLHALGKGGLLDKPVNGFNLNSYISWSLEALSISAVNIFMLISGYFLVDSKFKIKRLIELLCQCVFYSLGAFLICLICGIETGNSVDIYHILFTVFPAHMELYWFISAYIIIYMLQPVISAGVKQLTQKQLGVMIIILVIYESVFKSVLPIRFEGDKLGYDAVWFLVVFLIGAYFKLYGFKHLKTTSKGWLLYFASFALILLEYLSLEFVTSRTGRLTEINKVSLDYNHIFVLLEAIGIFAAFINMKSMKENVSKAVCALSPMALGVYLCHENLSLRYNWPKWLGIYGTLDNPTWLFLGKLFVAVIVIYVCGTVIDFIRIKLFKLVERLLTRGKNEA